MADVMKIVVVQDREDNIVDGVLLVMNYDERFDGIADKATETYYEADADGAAPCESIALTDHIVRVAETHGYIVSGAPWTLIKS